MTDASKKLRSDIRQSGQAIVRLTRTLSVEQFVADVDTRAAVERYFEIVGEAAARLKRTDVATFQAHPGFAGAVKLRNFITHVYDLVEPAKLWPTITAEVPELLAWVDAHLQ